MLVSDIPVLHEVGGDTAAYCDTSPEEIGTALERLLRSPEERARLVAAGNQKITEYSWDKVAEALYKQIQEAIS